MTPLTVTSCQAPNAEPFAQAVAAWLGQQLGRSARYVNGIPWQERERLLYAGVVDVGWICGLPYAWQADSLRPSLELLAAPVRQGARYRDKPVYFSDVVVRRDSSFCRFVDLRGASWAYNERCSHSGYNVTRYQLAQLGEYGRYFGRVVEAGSHQNALQMILRGEIDASAIDSTVLETELAVRPSLAAQIRVIDSFGPSPAPPWVISCRVSAPLRREIRAVLTGMHHDPAGQAILSAARVARFARVHDADYDPIRRMDALAQLVRLK